MRKNERDSAQEQHMTIAPGGPQHQARAYQTQKDSKPGHEIRVPVVPANDLPIEPLVKKDLAIQGDHLANHAVLSPYFDRQHHLLRDAQACALIPLAVAENLLVTCVQAPAGCYHDGSDRFVQWPARSHTPQAAWRVACEPP